MAHEAKLGLVFIGILLAVFGALLLKRLSRHGNLPPMNLNASATKSADGSSLSRLPPTPTPPTLVTPLNENSRPPEFVAIDRDALKQNTGAAWSSSKPHPMKTEITTSNSAPSSAEPPSLLAEPLPVATAAGSRYAAQNPDESSARLKSDLNHMSRDDSQSSSTTPLPYRSGYSADGDDSRSAPSATARQAQSEPPVDPFPRVNDTAVAEPPINNLRTTPANVASVSAGSTDAVNNDRYTIQPAPRTAVQNPSPTYDFAPRASAANDFTPQPAASGVVTASMPPAGIQRDGDQYTVGPNDSFWIISQKAYGTGGFFKALFELNRKRTKDSEDLKVGEVLTVPDEAVLRRMYPDLSPKPRKPVVGAQQRMISASNRLQGGGSVYTVVDGDTLFEIARHELGKPSRWAEIYELNHDVLGDDFDYLRPGTELILPEGPAGSSNPHGNTAIRQPDAIYPR